MLIKVKSALAIRWYSSLVGETIDVYPTSIRGRYRLLNNDHNRKVINRTRCAYDINSILKNEIGYCYGIVPEDCQMMSYSSNKEASSLLGGPFDAY